VQSAHQQISRTVDLCRKVRHSDRYQCHVCLLLIRVCERGDSEIAKPPNEQKKGNADGKLRVSPRRSLSSQSRQQRKQMGKLERSFDNAIHGSIVPQPSSFRLQYLYPPMQNSNASATLHTYLTYLTELEGGKVSCGRHARLNHLPTILYFSSSSIGGSATIFGTGFWDGHFTRLNR
jgi:hypothetical protein